MWAQRDKLVSFHVEQTAQLVNSEKNYRKVIQSNMQLEFCSVKLIESFCVVTVLLELINEVTV